MLTKTDQTKTFSLVTVKPCSLFIFFYFTNNFSEIGEKLLPFFRQYNLTLERFTKKENMPFFSKNANFVAWSHELLSQKDCVLLSQFLLSQVHVLAFFYNGHLWTPSRLKQIQKSFSEVTKTSHAHSSTFNIVWKSFHKCLF